MGRRTSTSSFWYSRSRSSSAPTTPRPEPATAAAEEPPLGCMSMVHYLIFAPGAGCVGRPPTSSNAIVTPHDGNSLAGDATSSSHSKSGFEAPRNSLDLDADNPNDIQIGVQIEPVFDALASSRTTSMRRSTKPTAPSSEAETPRTPSLVARLMGIDGLPDQQPSPPAQHKKPGRRSISGVGKENNSSTCCSPPASKWEKEKKKRVIPESMNRRDPLRSLSCNVGEARSLPDTPRASTSARASWDGARLSLQALKESVLDRAAHYMSMPSSPTSLAAAAAGSGKKAKKKDAASSRRRRDEKAKAAAKEHAREILRQAKETVASRKSGGKKNTASSSPAAEKRQSCFNKKENVVLVSSSAAPAMEDATKLRVAVVPVQQAAKPTTVAPKPSAEQRSPRVALAPLAPRQQQQQPSHPPPHRAKPSRPPPPPPPLDPPRTRARKPDGCERFATRIKKPTACPAASAPPTSTCSSPTTTEGCSTSAPSARARVPSSSPLEEDPEYRYLRTVLERGGFMRPSPPPRSRRAPWRGYSAASPVDPIVFHLLELELPAEESRLGPLRHRWNRKLLFHLAQELLADLLPGVDSSSSSTAMTTTTGLPLLGKVWRKARSFPALDCRVVGDIDALVAADLAEERRPISSLARHPAVVEEAGDVAEEVADRVLDALVAEYVAEESVSLSCCAARSSARAAAR